MLDYGALSVEALEYITQRIYGGVPPSVRELQKHLNLKSTSTVHKILEILQDKGLITKESGLNRCIKLPLDGNTSKVPLLGTVAAGSPILTVQEACQYVTYTGKYDSSELFALRIFGESMIKAGILNNDIVIVQKKPTAVNNEIVIALIDNEATVKRFFKENGKYRLQPENDAFAPIIVDSLTILGKVVAVMRFYD